MMNFKYYNMTDLRTHIDNHGKILIPSKLRKEMNCKPNDILILRYVDDQLVVLKHRDVLKQIQADFKKRGKSGKNAVDEFLEDRALERKLENKDGKKDE